MSDWESIAHSMQAKVKELEKEVRHLETSVASSEEVEKELQAENKLLYNVAGNYMQLITSLQAHINQLTNEKLTLQYKLRGWEEAYEDYLEDYTCYFLPPTEIG